MALNLKALKDRQKSLEEKTGKSDDLLYASSIKGEIKGRIGPPSAQMNGVYFTEAILYWINNKPYLSPKTFGYSCPIERELKEAMRSSDEDVIQLAEEVREASEYKLPWLPFSDPDDDKPEKDWKILVCGPMLIKSINKIATHRNYQPDITDPVVGFNIYVEKTGKGLNTNYSAFGDREPSELKESLFEAVPDPMEFDKKRLKDDDYLIAVIRNYLYDEEMPNDNKGKSKHRSDDVDDKPARKSRNDDDDKPSRSSRSKDTDDDAPVRKSSSRSRDDDDDRPSRSSRGNDDDDKPSRSSRSKDTDDDAPARRSRNDDDDDKPSRSSRSRDTDDDDKPSRSSRGREEKTDFTEERDEYKNGRKQDTDDDDKPSRKKDDSDDSPFKDDPEEKAAETKKAPAKKAPAKKATADKAASPSRRLLDDVDDLD